MKLKMTETGKNDESAELPLEGSPNRKQSVDSIGEQESAKGSDANVSTGSPISAVGFNTPTANRLSDAECFKTPDPSTPTSASAKKRKRLTPDEKMQREKERQEKRRKLEEEKQKKEEEKKQKELERLEKLKQKEAEKVKKEEERKRKEEEKRLEQLKRDEEKKKAEEAKLQEKLKKEEERKKAEEAKLQDKLKKEEERKKKEEERKQKEEEKERERLKLEEKKQKQAQAFTKFFQKSAAPKVTTIENGTVKTISLQEKSEPDLAAGADNATTPAVKSFNPLPFQIKTDMAVAPLCRRKMTEHERQQLDSLFDESANCDSKSEVGTDEFLKSIKNHNGRKSERTEMCAKSEAPDVQVLDDRKESSKPDGCFKWRMKLLQFEENRRPAYWGTWKRASKKVKPRNPFAKEEEVDYDFDSDDEWEDEPEDAEEIGDSGGEAEDKEDAEDAEEDEEGWMVPHGYLSDSERDGKGGDLEAMKCKEKEFYKSLKEKTMIGVPYIQTVDLACFTMRLCPVFKSANPVKTPARRKRAPKKAATADANTASTPKTEVKVEAPQPVVPAKAPLVQLNSDLTPPKTPVPQRKSTRMPKAAVHKENPYEKKSGFLAAEYPSDDEEDMDWADAAEEEDEDLSGSEGDSEMDDEEDDDTSDSNGEDLFIPIVKTKPKQSKSTE